jgi:alkanesulfonate monooxygenase SsuD/methylene tetrahydromethanopterin reductase-like flavin-dependent oxidoreductase (luciferase family)
MIKIGIAMLPEVDPARDGRWARCEDYGFAHAWCFDHLAWRSQADSPWHATVPVLVAATMTTSRIRLGTFVASPNFRHPVPFSKELMTLDVMSGGRLIAAIGAGAPGFDAAVLGQPVLTPRERQHRFEEFVTLLDLLLRNQRTTWSGEWFRSVEARTIPGPVQRPRPDFVIAANGPQGMRLARSKGQGWLTSGTAARDASPDEWWSGVGAATRRFDEIAATTGDVPAGFRRYLDLMFGAGPPSSLEKVRDDVGRATELGFTDAVLAWPRSREPFTGDERVIERVGAELSAAGDLTL